MNISDILARNIKNYMIEMKLTQRCLSEKTGISQTSISFWLRKLQFPSVGKIELLADAFGIPAYTLFIPEENQFGKICSTDPFDYPQEDWLPKQAVEFTFEESEAIVAKHKKIELVGNKDEIKFIINGEETPCDIENLDYKTRLATISVQCDEILLRG